MRVLFVSDLHLDEASPAATQQFLQFLSGEARTAQALYILGDLFEVWLGDDDDEPARASVCRALLALTRAGVPCFCLHGNRDFLLGAGFERRSGCTLLPDPVCIELGGESVLLTHGDALCSDDRAYQRLRAQVRRPTWQRRALRLPLSIRRRLAAGARAGSRAHTESTAATIMDVNPASVSAAMQSCGVRRLVHGHTHRPGVQQIHLPDGSIAERIVLGAWHDSGSVLRWVDGAYSLDTLARTAAAGRPE